MEHFARALSAMAVVLGEPMTEERVVGYCAVLNHYDESQLVAACGVFSKSCKWFPKPCEFIDLIATGELPGENHEQAAMAAWADIQRDSHNAYALHRTDPGAAAGIDALGGPWTMIHSDEDPRWQRKTFVAAYCGSVALNRRILMAPPGTDPRRLGRPEIYYSPQLIDGDSQEDEEELE